MRIGFHTLGCKVNQYETEAITEAFEDRGHEIVSFEEPADVYIINTCTVTGIADKKSRQMLSKAKKINENALVVAMGCYAQIAKEQLLELPSVDLIIGSSMKNLAVQMVEEALQSRNKSIYVQDIHKEQAYEELCLTRTGDKKRAHIKIQDGCNQFCSYCIIPYTRGRVRSRQPENVIKEIRSLVESGSKEIVLTGIHLGSYGSDLQDVSLIRLLAEINEIEGLERIRLGSLEPTLITEDFVETLKKLTKVCPHFHLSLQSGCDATLKRMNRKYTTDHFLRAVKLLRGIYDRPGITTDIIVGFPGETEEEFSVTMAFVKEIGFSDIHVFKFSPRNGTKAATMDEQVAGTVKNERSKALTNLRNQLHSAYLESFIAQNDLVLFEEKVELNRKSFYQGHTSRYIEVFTEDSGEDLENQVRSVQMENILNESIIGKLMKL